MAEEAGRVHRYGRRLRAKIDEHASGTFGVVLDNAVAQHQWSEMELGLGEISSA